MMTSEEHRAPIPSVLFGTLGRKLGDLLEVPTPLFDGIPRRSLVPTTN